MDSLLDYYAAAALTGLLANTTLQGWDPDQYADHAFNIAVAMLELSDDIHSVEEEGEEQEADGQPDNAGE